MPTEASTSKGRAALAVGAGAVAAAVLTCAHAFGADLPALEDAIRRASADRDRTVAERSRLMGEAGALADEIARVKTRSEPAARAGADLEDALKRFDRITAQLDVVDARSADLARGIAAARRKFEDAATAETARLTAAAASAPIGEITRALRSVEEMRRRVSLLASARPAFRPVLEVSLSPDDGAGDVARKIAVVEAERARVAGRLEELDGEDAVLATRAALKRQLLVELQGAARTAGPDLALLRRETDDATDALGVLASRRAAVAQEQQDLTRTLRELDRHGVDFRTRLKNLESKGDPR